MAKWADPFAHIICVGDESPALAILFIASAARERVLSERALAAVERKISDGESWADEEVKLSDDENCQLLDLVLCTLEQSYSLACSDFDEPQMALWAVDLLFQVTRQLPTSAAVEILLRLGETNELTASRIVRHSILHSVPINLEVETKIFTIHLLFDLRVLIERKKHVHAEILIDHILRLNTVIDLAASIHDALELIYLIAEHKLSTREYGVVINITKLFSHAWEVSKAIGTCSDGRKRIQSCIARALEATGELQLAQDKYDKYHLEDSIERLTDCIAGKTMYWSQQAQSKIPGRLESSFIDARELDDGSIGVFTRRTDADGNNLHVGFIRVSSDSGFESQQEMLPHGGTRWKSAKVVPGLKSEPLRLLVAPRPLNSSGTTNGVSEGVEDMIGMIGPPFRKERPYLPIQLWEYHRSEWKEISTRGNIPDISTLSVAMWTHCAMLQGKIILFCSGMLEMVPGLSKHHGAFILDLQNKEWLQVPHPYASSLYLNSDRTPAHSAPVNYSLPPFSTVSTVVIQGGETLAMLRNGKPLRNERRGNELVPKHAVDLFGTTEVSTESSRGRPNCWWYQDVITQDSSGYIADLNCTSLAMGRFLIVIGTGQSGLLQKANGAGTTTCDVVQDREATTNVLDLQNLEWRGTSIRNSWLVGSGLGGAVLVESSESNRCYLVTANKASNILRLLCLHNTCSVAACLTKRISERKRLSKKLTISYQLDQAKKHHARPLRKCANCLLLEGAGLTFPNCARCKRVFYCSRLCQKRHWKAVHKSDCCPLDEASA